MPSTTRTTRTARTTVRTATAAALVAALTALTLPGASAAPAEPRTEKLSTGPGGVQANAFSNAPEVSADGSVVVFTSIASNLVAGDTPNTDDVFVHRAGSSALTRITVSGATTSAPHLSSNGRYLTFVARDKNNVSTLHLRDLAPGAGKPVRTVRIDTKLPDGYRVGGNAPISTDGRYLALNTQPTDATPSGADDGNRVYLLDRTTGKTVRVSHSPDMTNGFRSTGAGSISDDGGKIAYYDGYINGPRGDDWGDIYVWDRTTGKEVHADATYNGAQADKASTTPLLSGDGTKVAFQSFATNLVPGTDPNRGWNPFVRDLTTGKLSRVDGIAPTDISGVSGISRDGRQLLISSNSSTSGESGIYVRDLTTGASTLASPGLDGKPQGAGSSAMSADGSTVAFSGYDESRFVEGDTNGESDVFLRRLR
ncbi:TolB family protein [Streptomyces sp. NPDC051561]|uniref:TolB family protein n=1 Tax=Streptomyces sp. NPDC051561 TaxID=3365658 RepID=UPI00378FBC3B